MRMYLWCILSTFCFLAYLVRVTRRDTCLFLCSCDVFRALINSPVSGFCTNTLGLALCEIVATKFYFVVRTIRRAVNLSAKSALYKFI